MAASIATDGTRLGDELLVVEDLKKHFPVTRGIVFQKEVQNTLDDRMVRHCLSPTKSMLGFPVVTSLKLKMMARKNGNATRPMM